MRNPLLLIKNACLILFFVFGCAEKAEITRLWELSKVSVDMYDRGFKPTYLHIGKDGTFSASREDGDLVGLYRLDESVLTFSSDDQIWFDKRWELFATDNELVLNDLKHSFRGEQLRFRKIETFPSFEEFMEKVTGEWKLYKIIEGGRERDVYETFLSIKDDTYEPGVVLHAASRRNLRNL